MDQSIFVTQKGNRIHQTLRYALITAAVFGVLWTVLVEFSPNLFIYIFMKPIEHILAISLNIIRSYGISFLLLPFNIFSTYYFQALMQPQNIIYYFCFKRFRDQWNLKHCTTTICFGECDMVYDANLWNCLYPFSLRFKCVNSPKNYHMKI